MFKGVLKKTLTVIGVIIIIMLVGFSIWTGWFFHLLGSGCTNGVLDSSNSPDQQYKVVIFGRNCGATTDFSTHVSVLTVNENTDKLSTGNILIIDSNNGQDSSKNREGGPVVISQWEGPKTLIITFNSKARSYQKVQRYKDIEIRYLTN